MIKLKGAAGFQVIANTHRFSNVLFSWPQVLADIFAAHWGAEACCIWKWINKHRAFNNRLQSPELPSSICNIRENMRSIGCQSPPDGWPHHGPMASCSGGMIRHFFLALGCNCHQNSDFPVLVLRLYCCHFHCHKIGHQRSHSLHFTCSVLSDNYCRISFSFIIHFLPLSPSIWLFFLSISTACFCNVPFVTPHTTNNYINWIWTYAFIIDVIQLYSDRFQFFHPLQTHLPRLLVNFSICRWVY